jgi:saccharopine dehydrogenase-like NADP-dependent oxidoreductase
MVNQVLVIGGRGRVGQGVVVDLLAYTDAQITVTGRSANPKQGVLHSPRVKFLALNLSDRATLQSAIAVSNLVIHCAGPFHYRGQEVLQACIDQGVNYLDVSDHRMFTRSALSYREVAESTGVTAIINTGVFPGISNSLARQGAEQLDTPEEIHLSYAVAGSGGAAVTAIQTTFLSLQLPFIVWLKGQWQEVKPYTGRELVDFPEPFNQVGVYWFDMPELLTLVDSFPVHTVSVKFGSIPDLYNRLTWMVANLFPNKLIQHPTIINLLSQVSYAMTGVSDRFSGVGVAIRAEVRGQHQGKPACYWATFTHDNATIATGMGAGSIAQILLSGKLKKPGVWTVEQAVPTALFREGMELRQSRIHQGFTQGAVC